MPKLRLYGICAAVMLLACGTTAGLLRLGRPVPQPRAVGAAAKVPAIDTDELRCRTRWEYLSVQAALPGSPQLEAARPEIMARAKAEPLIFLDVPKAQPRDAKVARLRERLYRDAVPWQGLGEVFSQLKREPKLLRQVLLTDGYLYTDKPDLAALLSGISLNQLFEEKELEVTRGTTTRLAVRHRDEYLWVDGVEAGQTARLWLFDRVTPRGVRLTEANHVAVGGLREELGANRIEVVHLVPGAALAHLIYGDESVDAVFSTNQGRLALECEAIAASKKSHLEGLRALNRRRRAVLARLHESVMQQVEEGLPFDEPKTEEGQQDGKLRSEWRTAYLAGQLEFEFNGDKYPVFGRNGVARTPQVCVDFITDSWERMAGTHWARRNEGRARLIGRLDFNAVDIANRRSVENLIDFAVAHPEWFDLMLIPETERVPFATRNAFFRRLYALRADFQPGDVVAILGPRDDEKLHYHSFFVLADDPFTSMPMLVASNAGRPRVRTWEGEMQNAPRRSIMARIRPRLEWLERIVGLAGAGPATMAKL